jgi:mannose-6-phosphate isomerase-like protein (cupin superfamily)
MVRYLWSRVMLKSFSTLVLLLGVSLPAGVQRASVAKTGPVTFAILVTDAAGAPVTDVRVSVTGPVQRSARTEGGRLVFENLPSGEYQFKFEKAGFVPVDQTVTGRGTKPISVNVTMDAIPEPPKPVAPVTPIKARAADAKLVVLDMPAFVEKNYVGKSTDRTTPMACAAGGSSTLIQINVAITEHTHPDADEFIYVIAGQGSARMGERVEPIGPGVYMMIPRRTPHAFAVGNKKPLVFVSTLAGEKCM